MSEIRDALQLHLLQCGFVDPDDNTVPIFTGNDPHFAWTSVDKLIDALTARFEIRDRQVPDNPETRCMNGPAKQHTLRMVAIIKALKAAAVNGQLPASVEPLPFVKIARAIVDHWPRDTGLA